MAAKGEIEERLSERSKDDEDAEEYVRKLKRYGAAESLTREMCMELIDYITVGEKNETGEREVHIYYKFLADGSSEEFRKNKIKTVP